MPRSHLFLLVWVSLMFVVVRPAGAQETVNFASVSGRVVDPSAGVVSGAQVAARHTETNISATATTDQDGRFRFPHLKVGPYEITIQAAGFTKVTRRLTLTVGSVFDLPVQLSVGGLETAVTVTADATVLETGRSQIASTVALAEVKTLPMNGRNFLDLALLVPGVSPTNVGGGTQLFPETSAVQGVGLSVSSQRNLSNNFMVDGLSANDDAAALSGISFGIDAIEQFQVVTAGGQAELGRALGGHINIATRSGTNTRNGTAYGFFRDDRFNGVNPLLAESPFLKADPALRNKLPLHQNQYGASLGGPISRDRTFYFVNFEQRFLDQSGLTTIGATNPTLVDQINARLSAVGYQGPPVRTGIYPNPIDTTHVLGKVDHHLFGGDLLSIRYSAYTARSENARGVGGTNAPSASSSLDNIDQAIAVGNVWTLSSKTVLESRGQVSLGDLKAPATDAVGPAVSIQGVASFGTSSGSPTRRQNTMYQVVNNLWHQAGSHAIRAGVDFLFNDDTITYPRSIRGSYSFANLNNFLTGTYNNNGFTQTFGETTVAQTNPNLGLYLQDEWRLSSRVSVNGGLRYDLQWLKTINTDTNNVSPRVGAVWSPFASGRWLVRGSLGRFYDRVPLRALANAILSAGNTTDLSALRQIAVSLSPNQTGAPVFPNILTSIVPTTTLVNFTTMDRNIQNAHSDQFSIEVERQLGAVSKVSVGYDYLRGRQLIMQINQNVPTCAVSGNNNGCRPNPAYANNNQYSSAGKSNYKGVHLAFVQRPTRWGSYRVSYTYSQSMNNVGEAFFNGPIDAFDLDKDWARSDDDQRHRLVVTGAINTSMAQPASRRDWLSHGYQFSWMVQYYSALPFNITTGTNTIQGTAARPTVDGVFISRNAGVASPFSSTSMRLSRTVMLASGVHLEGLIEAFNVFNRRNNLARTTVFGTGAYPTNPAASFGTITVVGDPRSFQFGLRVRF